MISCFIDRKLIGSCLLQKCQNIHWLQILHCEDLQLFFNVLRDKKLMCLGFGWFADQKKQFKNVTIL